MDHGIDVLTAELERVTHDVGATFGGLSHQQLNWKPTADSWSIAQCLDHLIAINRLYFPQLASLRTDPPTPGFWERYSPFSGFLGKLLIRTLSPDSPKKMKTSPKAEPSKSQIEGIVQRFAHHQDELIAHFRGIPDGVDRQRTIVTSPLLRSVTYSLDDCLKILVVHEQRHFLQAKHVMEAPGFPNVGSDGHVGGLAVTE